MSANTLVLFLNWAVFLALFVRVLAEAIQRPWRVNVDVALLFSIPAASALFGIARYAGLLPASLPVGRISLALLVLIGSATIIWGVRYVRIPPNVVTIAFALTAASWLAFLIAAIGAVVVLLGFPSA